MAVRIVSKVLPDIGVRREMTLHDGRTVGVVVRRSGGRELVVLDGDTQLAHVELGDDEADALAELVGSPKLLSRLSALQHEADALLTEQLFVPPTSPYVGRPLGETRARTRTGVSVVAVVRDGATQPAPGPDFVLESGDLVLAVGTREGIDQLGRVLDGTG